MSKKNDYLDEQIVIPIGEIEIVRNTEMTPTEFYKKRYQKMREDQEKFEVNNKPVDAEIPKVSIVQENVPETSQEPPEDTEETNWPKTPGHEGLLVESTPIEEVVIEATETTSDITINAKDDCPIMTEEEIKASLARKISPKYGRCNICGLPLKKDGTHRKMRADVGKKRKKKEEND